MQRGQAGRRDAYSLWARSARGSARTHRGKADAEHMSASQHPSLPRAALMTPPENPNSQPQHVCPPVQQVDVQRDQARRA